MTWWKTSPSPASSRQVQELAEDIRVAILEFQDRYPGTTRAEIRQALRLVKRKGLNLHEKGRTRGG